MNEGVSSTGPSSTGKQTAKVKSGVWMREMPVEPGKTTVGDLRKAMKNQGRVPDGAKAYSGSTELSDETLVEPNQDIQFVKKTGEKGS